MDFCFKAILTPDPDDGLLVTFSDVPEAITHGKTVSDALLSGRDALGLALRGRCQEGQTMPIARSDQGFPVHLAPDDALKLAVIHAFKESGITKTELARRLGRRETEARRILDPYHATGLPLLQSALSVLGKTVIVSVVNTMAA